MSKERVGQVVLKVIGISGNKEDGKVWEWEQLAVLEPGGCLLKLLSLPLCGTLWVALMISPVTSSFPTTDTPPGEPE